MPRRENTGYAPPVSLKAYCDYFGVDMVGQFIRDCLPDAEAMQPKQGESWRFAFWETILIGYTRSATITGHSSQDIAAVAVRLKELFTPRPQDAHLIEMAVYAAITFVNKRTAFAAPSHATTYACLSFFDDWGKLDAHAQLHALHALRQQCRGEAETIECYVHFTQTLLTVYTCGIQEGIDIGLAQAKERFFWDAGDDDGDREDAAAGEKLKTVAREPILRSGAPPAPPASPARTPDTLPRFIVQLSDSLIETA